MNLFEKVAQKQATIAIIGLGYVGLPLAIQSNKRGFTTFGIDISEAKIQSLNDGHSYIDAITDEEIARTKCNFTNDFSYIDDCDIVVITVPTPVNTNNSPDMTFVLSAAQAIKEHLHKDMLVVLESTVFPGATDETVQPILEASGLECSKDFHLAFSPERINTGDPYWNVTNTPKIIGCNDTKGLEIAQLFYSTILDGNLYLTQSTKVAETAKLLENTYRNVNFALVNEFARICGDLSIDIWDVVAAASTKPFGFQSFEPCIGIGGHCIPVDPYYMLYKGESSLIRDALHINETVIDDVVSQIADIIDIRGAKVLMCGVAYKANVNDYRNSPYISLMRKLSDGGAEVQYYDHKVKDIGIAKSIELTNVADYDMVIIGAPHDIDYSIILQNAKVVFDCNNKLKSCQANVVTAFS